MITSIIWVLGTIIAILMVKMILKITESKDPIYKMFVENGLNADNLYGLTKNDRKKLKRFRRESYLIFALGLIVFILVIVKDKL